MNNTDFLLKGFFLGGGGREGKTKERLALLSQRQPIPMCPPNFSLPLDITKSLFLIFSTSTLSSSQHPLSKFWHLAYPTPSSKSQWKALSGSSNLQPPGAHLCSDKLGLFLVAVRERFPRRKYGGIIVKRGLEMNYCKSKDLGESLRKLGLALD